MGPPGSGKGTQGRTIANSNQFVTIVTGEMLRSESTSGSDLGNDIKAVIDAGNLISDEMMNDIIEIHLENLEIPAGYGILFDGYPRTVEQAEFLDGIITIDKVILLEVAEEVLIKRILKRGNISNRIDDKDKSIIKTRMDNYNSDTLPLKAYYEEQGKLVILDGDKKVKDIHDEMVNALV